MAWCCQATSHYLSQCWPRSLSPYGVIRPQWVKPFWCWCWNTKGGPGQYCGGWCPGSCCRQGISSHIIDYVIQVVGPSLLPLNISTIINIQSADKMRIQNNYTVVCSLLLIPTWGICFWHRSVRHRENFWDFTRPRRDFCQILPILNMIVHKSFTGPAHFLSANVRGPVSFAVSEVCKYSLHGTSLRPIYYIYNEKHLKIELNIEIISNFLKV